jgi:UDP-N-acetylglucosamine acyltransferase
VVGEAPQDLKYQGAPTRLRIGDDNVFREYVTVHRSTKVGEETRLGSRNFLMAHCHVGHNCHVGDQVIIANGALLGGHASVADRAFISGNCLVHQFVRVGMLALMQGGSAVSTDLPPFTMVHDVNRLCGLNTIGLRRAGMTAAERLELRQLYRALFRKGLNLRAAIAAAKTQFTSPASVVMLEFLRSAKRGVCSDAGPGGDSEND